MINKSKTVRYSIPVMIVLLWYILSKMGIWSNYIFPSPERVFIVAISLLKSGELVRHMAVSLGRVVLGFSISFLIAFPLGIIMGIHKGIAYNLDATLEFLRHVPPLALIPILILWFGIGEKSKIIVIILASFFPMLLNITKGIGDCNTKLIEVGKSFGFSSSKIFYKIILPNALKDIMVGMRIGLGYSWRAIIGAELIAASSGIGY